MQSKCFLTPNPSLAQISFLADAPKEPEASVEELEPNQDNFGTLYG